MLQQLPLESIQLRLPAVLARGVRIRQRLGQHVQPFYGLPDVPICLGQEGKIIRLSHLRPRFLPGSEALAHHGSLMA